MVALLRNVLELVLLFLAQIDKVFASASEKNGLRKLITTVLSKLGTKVTYFSNKQLTTLPLLTEFLLTLLHMHTMMPLIESDIILANVGYGKQISETKESLIFWLGHLKCFVLLFAHLLQKNFFYTGWFGHTSMAAPVTLGTWFSPLQLTSFVQLQEEIQQIPSPSGCKGRKCRRAWGRSNESAQVGK